MCLLCCEQHLQQQSIQGQQLQQQRGAPNARSSAGVGVEDSRGGADGSYSSGVFRVREREFGIYDVRLIVDAHLFA